MGILDGWRFCPRCTGVLSDAPTSLRCDACGFEAWGNSVPGAQAVVTDGDRVLLGRRARDPSQGLWDLPGGFLEEGEHPLAGLRREVLEETACAVEPEDFLGFWIEPYEGRSVLCITWLATIASGTPTAGDDLVDLRWFAHDELPSVEQLAFPSYADILGRWRSLRDDRVGRSAGLE